MASYDEKQEKSKTQDSGFFIFTEKFWDWSWSLKILIFVLFFDCAFIYLTGKGLYELQNIGSLLTEKFGIVVSLLALFGVFVVVFIPTASYAISEVIFPIYIDSGLYRLFQHNPDNSRHIGYVRYSQLQEPAYRSGNPLMIRLYEENREKFSAFHQTMYQVALLVLTILFLFIVNWNLPYSQFKNASITNIFLNAMGENGLFIGVLITIGIVIVLLRSWSPDGDHLQWIYYPPLYDELQEKHRQAQEAQRDFERKVQEQLLQKNNQS